MDRGDIEVWVFKKKKKLRFPLVDFQMKYYRDNDTPEYSLTAYSTGRFIRAENSIRIYYVAVAGSAFRSFRTSRNKSPRHRTIKPMYVKLGPNLFSLTLKNK